MNTTSATIATIASPLRPSGRRARASLDRTHFAADIPVRLRDPNVEVVTAIGFRLDSPQNVTTRRVRAASCEIAIRRGAWNPIADGFHVVEGVSGFLDGTAGDFNCC